MDAVLRNDTKKIIAINIQDFSSRLMAGRFDDLSALAQSLLSMGEPKEVFRVFKFPELSAAMLWEDSSQEEKDELFQKCIGDKGIIMRGESSMKLKIFILELKLSFLTRRNFITFIPRFFEFNHRFALALESLKEKDDILKGFRQSWIDAIEGKTYPVEDLWEQVECE